jgi:Domain of unknown function (DUF4397)
MFLLTTKLPLEKPMRSFLKPLFLLLALAFVSVFLISCNSNSSVQARFVNAIYLNGGSYNGSLDVEFNGTKDFTNVTFPNASASSYKAIPGGNVTILGLAYNTTTQVFSENTTLNGGTDYTIVASGQAGGTGNDVFLNAFADNNTVPATGTVNFRVINASDIATSVDVYIEPSPFTGTLGQNGVTATFTISENAASTYVNLPWNSGGGGWTIYVTPAGNPGGLYFPGFNTGNFGGTGTDAIRTIVLTNDVNAPATLSSQPLVLADLN